MLWSPFRLLGQWTGKSCFNNRVLVDAISELWNAFKYSVFEPQNWSRLKPLLLKHYYRRQDGNQTFVPVRYHHRILPPWASACRLWGPNASNEFMGATFHLGHADVDASVAQSCPQQPSATRETFWQPPVRKHCARQRSIDELICRGTVQKCCSRLQKKNSNGIISGQVRNFVALCSRTVFVPCFQKSIGAMSILSSRQSTSAELFLAGLGEARIIIPEMNFEGLLTQ